MVEHRRVVHKSGPAGLKLDLDSFSREHGPTRCISIRIMNKSRHLLILIAVVAVTAAVGVALGARSPRDAASPEQLAAAQQTRTVYSEVYAIDRKYRSMMGPGSAWPTSTPWKARRASRSSPTTSTR